MDDRIKLTEDNFNYEYSGDTKHIKWELANHPRYTNPWTEEEANQLKQQILDDHKKINRFNQIFANYKKVGAPINKPELTGVDQGVIDQIQNVIIHTLEYIEDGKAPEGYAGLKNHD